MPLIPLVAIGVAAAVAGTAVSVVSSLKQSKALKRQAAAEREGQVIQQKRANVLAAKDRFAQIREARIKRASILSSTVNAGLFARGTSGFSGATSSIGAQE